MIPDKQRLLIKSTRLELSQDGYEDEVAIVDGEEVKRRIKVRDKVIIPADATYSVNLKTKKLTVTSNGKSKKYDISDHAMKQKDKPILKAPREDII